MQLFSKYIPQNFSFRLFGVKIQKERRGTNKSNLYPVLRDRRKDFFSNLYIATKERVFSYLFSTLLVLSVFLIELLLEPYVPIREAPFLFYFIIVALATLEGNMRVGWFTTLLTAIVTNFHFRNFSEQTTLTRDAYFLRLATFVFEGVLVSILVDRIKKSENSAVLRAELLRSSEQQLRNVLNSLYSFVGVMTTDGILIEVNNAALNSANLAPEDVLGKRFEETYWWSYNEDSKKKLRRAIKKAAAGKSVRYDHLIRLSKNRFVTMDFAIAPISDDKGEIIYLIPSGVDVTDRVKTLKENRQLLKALELEKRRIDTIIGNVPGVVWEASGRLYSKEQTVTYMSDYIEQLTGYNVDDFERDRNLWLNLVHPEDRQKLIEEVQSNYNNSKGGVIKHRWLTRSGKTIWMETRYVVSYDESGIPVGTQGVTVDITEQQLNDMKKDEFIGIASHELKTPITTIKAFTQILEKRLEGKGDLLSTQYLKKMDDYISRLTKIIYDFLDFSKIQAGKLEYNNEAIDIDKLVNEVVEDMQSANETHKIIKKGSSSATIEGDKTRLSQVLINLISNAIKYSPEADKVIVEVTENQKNVIISVRDYGIGIPKDRQRKLFERFYRVSNPKKIKIEGFGLGLYISKEIVGRHGGHIKVDSSPGKGSTFYFNLPIKQKTE